MRALLVVLVVLLMALPLVAIATLFGGPILGLIALLLAAWTIDRALHPRESNGLQR